LLFVSSSEEVVFCPLFSEDCGEPSRSGRFSQSTLLLLSKILTNPSVIHSKGIHVVSSLI